MNKEQKVIEKAKALVKAFYPITPHYGKDMNALKEALEELDAPELITMDGEYQYRNGEPARILCVDRNNIKPVISLAENGDVNPHYKSGKYNHENYIDDNYDLIPVKKRPRECDMFAGSEVDSHIQRVVDHDY